MKKYNYYKNVKKDINKNLSKMLNNQVTNSFDLYDEITGSHRGVYTSCPKTASCYIRQNMDLLNKACHEYGCDFSEYINYPCRCDTIIRCYVFKDIFEDVVKDYFKKHPINQEGE